MPSASAMRLTCISAANSVCGAPKPRKAPLGGVFVATARPRMRTLGHVVGPAGVERAARQHDRRQRAVRAAVDDDLDVLRHEAAVARHAGAVAHDRRMALGRRGQVLVAVVDHPHGLAHALGQQRGMDGDHRRVLLLAAEAAAGLGLDDHGLLV